MNKPTEIQLPVPYLGFVNLWLLEGDPLTLIDAGPCNPEAMKALEERLAALGLTVEDIELVLITHHHLDHSALAATIKKRSGARIAAHRGTARWGADYHERVAHEHVFTLALMAEHGTPDRVIEA